MLIHSEYEGIFTLSAFKCDENGNEIPGSRREPVPPFKNLITNGGLNRMGTSADYLNWCQVGSGSTTPVNDDTSLVSRIAGTSTLQSTAGGSQPSAPYYTYRRNVKRFGLGVAAGNLAEVGIGWATSGSLFSRALIKDAFGDPTTITILADEYLDVTYELRCYPKTTDTTGTVVATGNLAGTYDFIMRASNVTDSTTQNGWEISSGGRNQNSTNTAGGIAYPGDIGAIASSPSGSPVFTSSTISSNAYSQDSFEMVFFMSLGLNDANINIRSVRIKMGIGVYQCQFDPAIPKTSEDLLNLTFKHSWARRP